MSGWDSARPGGKGYVAPKYRTKEHRTERARRMAELTRNGVGVCCLGGEPIYPWMALHLDHTPDGTGYRGLACATHNRSDGAKRGRAKQNPPQSKPRAPRSWSRS